MVREASVIDGDDDIDLFVNSKHYAEIKDIIIKSGYTVSVDTKNLFLQAKKKINNQMTYSDFYFYTVTKDFIVDRWNFFGAPRHPKYQMNIPKDMFFPIKEETVSNMKLKIPSKPKLLCEFFYGSRYLEKMSKSKKEYESTMVNGTPKIKYNIPEKP